MNNTLSFAAVAVAARISPAKFYSTEPADKCTASGRRPSMTSRVTNANLR
jgi:hypothetical protein